DPSLEAHEPEERVVLGLTLVALVALVARRLDRQAHRLVVAWSPGAQRRELVALGDGLQTPPALHHERGRLHVDAAGHEELAIVDVRDAEQAVVAARERLRQYERAFETQHLHVPQLAARDGHAISPEGHEAHHGLVDRARSRSALG